MDEVGSGVITKVVSDFSVVVRTPDGFDYTKKVSDLVLVEDVGYGEVKQKDHAEEKQKKSKKHATGEIIEVDLHMVELVDDHRNMTNFEIVKHQMQVFERTLHDAMRKGVSRIVFIHGVGEGVLRSEIHTKLSKNYPQLEYYDASYKKYGHGATEVRLS